MKTKTLIVIIGILILSVGIYHLLFSTILAQPNEISITLNTLSKGFLFSFDPQIAFINYSIKILKVIFIILHFLAGFLLLKNKPLGRYLANILGFFYLYRIFYYFAFLGLVYREVIITVSLLSSFGLLYAINIKSIREYFPCGKKLKVISIVLMSILLIIVLAFAYLTYTISVDSPKFDNSEYSPISFDKDEETITFDFPPYFSVDFPTNNIAMMRQFIDPNNPSLYFVNPIDSIMFTLDHEASFLGVIETFTPNYAVPEIVHARKIVTEKYGFLYQIYNGRVAKLFGTINSFRTYKHNNLEVFYLPSIALGEYCYYSKQLGKGSIYIYNMSTRTRQKPIESNIKVVNQITGSVKSLPIIKTANDYFNDGLELYTKNEYKKAAFSFLSSLLLDNENPNTNFYMAKSISESDKSIFYSKTSELSSTIKYLENTLKFEPTNSEAEQLLIKTMNEKYDFDLKEVNIRVLADTTYESIYDRASIYEERGYIDEALLDCHDIIENEKHENELREKAILKASNLYIESGVLDKAESTLEKALNEYHNNNSFIRDIVKEYAEVARTYTKQLSFKDAERIIEIIEKFDLTKGLNLYLKGDIEEKKGNYFEAVKLWMRTYQCAYTPYDLSFKLAIFYSKIEQPALAEKFLISAFKRKDLNNNSEFIKSFNYSEEEEIILFELIKIIASREEILDDFESSAYILLNNLDVSKFDTIEEIQLYYMNKK